MSLKRRKKNPTKRKSRNKIAGNSASENLLARAKQAHQKSDHHAADKLYNQLLKREPDNVDVLHFYGVLQYQHGDQAMGISMVRRAIALQPDYADAYNNLGNMLKLEGRLEEAEASYVRSLELSPTVVDSMINLGVLARSRQAYKESEQWCRKAIAHNPEHPLSYVNLASVLEQQGKPAEALDAVQISIQKTIQINASDEQLHYRRANILLRLGRTDDAREVYETWLKAIPGNQTAEHMLAAITGINVPDKPGEHYVKNLFDRFSQSFDEVLDNLGYKAPELVGEMVASSYPQPQQKLHILDAGCGTGLCGQYLKPYADRLIGVDLSAGMLSRAERTNHYDELIEAEIVQFLRDNAAEYDLVVSADTFCYFGVLEELFTGIGRSLNESGRLVFTVELTDLATDAGYLLQTHGRYCHAREYVEASLQQAGLATEKIEKVTLRYERAEAVEGYLVCAHK